MTPFARRSSAFDVALAAAGVRGPRKQNRRRVGNDLGLARHAHAQLVGDDVEHGGCRDEGLGPQAVGDEPVVTVLLGRTDPIRR